MAKLEIELVKLQGWIKHTGMKVVVVFEGRDSASKGGTIKHIKYRINAQYCRIMALGTPTEKEKCNGNSNAILMKCHPLAK